MRWCSPADVVLLLLVGVVARELVAGDALEDVAGVTWLRLDDGFATHPKIVALSDRQLRVWLRVLCYCSTHDDPTVDSATISAVNGLRNPDVLAFHALGLLDEIGEVFEVHDWLDYRPKDPTGAERQARWRSRQVGKGVTRTVTRSGTKPSLARAPFRPDPSTPIADAAHGGGDRARDVADLLQLLDASAEVGEFIRGLASHVDPGEVHELVIRVGSGNVRDPLPYVLGRLKAAAEGAA